MRRVAHMSLYHVAERENENDSSFDPGSNTSYLILIALFDGLFVFHYIIETICKFSQPHHRQILAPIYFGPAAPKPNPVA